MRPIKDIFIEEYWTIGYRNYTDSDTVVNADKAYSFDLLKGNSRYWYADPFLFEKDGKTFLFVEMFDNVTEVGEIGLSELVDGKFTEPEIVIKEKFHLSYPYVYEKNGKVYMMPETHEDGCIQTYVATDFPRKWKKCEVIVDNINAADTVIENDILLTSEVCPSNDMSIDFCAYDSSGKELEYSPVYKSSLTKRGAGAVFGFSGKRIRPAQSCEDSNYGGKLFFYSINQCDKNGYSEELFSELSKDKVLAQGNKTAYGVHTYARTDKIEVVDIKFKRFNFKRFFWIIKRKLGI